MGATSRPTSFWLAALRRRRAHQHDELGLDEPISWNSDEERRAAAKFFNAAFRAEESGLRQAHELADEVAELDPDLAEVLRLYGAEEGWLGDAEKTKPFGRLLEVDEVSRAVAYLASAESGMMTGSIIDFDQQVRGAGNSPPAPPPVE